MNTLSLVQYTVYTVGENNIGEPRMWIILVLSNIGLFSIASCKVFALPIIAIVIGLTALWGDSKKISLLFTMEYYEY